MTQKQAFALVRIFFAADGMQERIEAALAKGTIRSVAEETAEKIRNMIVGAPNEDDLARSILDLIIAMAREALAEDPPAALAAASSAPSQPMAAKSAKKVSLDNAFDEFGDDPYRSAAAKLIAVDLIMNQLQSDCACAPVRRRNPRSYLSPEIAGKLIADLETAKSRIGVPDGESELARAIAAAREASHSCRYRCGNMFSGTAVAGDLAEAVRVRTRMAKAASTETGEYLAEMIQLALFLSAEIKAHLEMAAKTAAG